jgi:HEPN domain-containing protein
VNRAEDWLKQAHRDLAAARDSANAGYHEWAAFQAQQCAEKAAKALVQSLHGSVRGHSVTDILSHLPASAQAPPTVLDSARELDKIYVTARYPNGFAAGAPGDYFTEKSSRQLIEQASHVLEFCRSKIH